MLGSTGNNIRVYEKKVLKCIFLTNCTEKLKPPLFWLYNLNLISQAHVNHKI
uniref:Uncharacterized protein n=1 Tax=Anguilla anguilla TaxID=7936 RepID=A0A0E9WC42_ANGAN